MTTPQLITRIESSESEIIFEADRLVVCEPACETTAADSETTATIKPAPRVLSAENAYQTASMMRDVITGGTGRKAMELGRSDLSGKTGTTNDQRDAWFSGYNRDIVTTVWVGFDKYKPLGNSEAGGVAALPIWMDYMKVALQDRPEHTLERPAGMLTLSIDPETGLATSDQNPAAIKETFRAQYAPEPPAFDFSQSVDENGQSVDIPEQLF